MSHDESHPPPNATMQEYFIQVTIWYDLNTGQDMVKVSAYKTGDNTMFIGETKAPASEANIPAIIEKLGVRLNPGAELHFAAKARGMM